MKRFRNLARLGICTDLKEASSLLAFYYFSAKVFPQFHCSLQLELGTKARKARKLFPQTFRNHKLPLSLRFLVSAISETKVLPLFPHLESSEQVHPVLLVI